MMVDTRAAPPARAVPAARLRLSALVLAGCVAGSLGGCATAPGATATCTDLISTGGGLLKFCQNGDKLHVTETGIDPAAAADDVKIVDDPSVLDALQRRLGLRPAFRGSRRVIAHACVVKGGDFVSISLTDLKRIIDAPVRARSVQTAALAGGRPAEGD